jgi:hypothetical protein
MRMASSRSILDLSAPNHFITEIATQVLWGTEINSPPTNQSRQLGFDLSYGEKTRLMAVFELNQQIYIAIRTIRALQRRAEKGYLPNMVAAA